MNEAGKPAVPAFLSRWSRRKIDAGKTAAERAVAPADPTNVTGIAPPAEPVAHPIPATVSGVGTDTTGHPQTATAVPAESRDKPELPSIDSLTHEADFSPFMAKDVDPGLRNQAMKKLFTDPHYQFGQMDKLDIYIDDYSQPDPIPPEMLRQMYQAKSLFLFDDEEKDASLPNDPDVVHADAIAATAPGLDHGDANDARNTTLENVELPDGAEAKSPENFVGLDGKPVIVKSV